MALLAVLKATEFREIRELHQKIKEQGHSLTVSQFEAGSVIGVRGTTLDTRRIRLALETFTTAEQLKSTKKLIQERWTYPLETYIDLLEPARGTINSDESGRRNLEGPRCTLAGGAERETDCL